MLQIPCVADADVRPNCRTVQLIRMRDEQLQKLNVLRCAAALLCVVGIYENGIQ